MKKTVQVTAMAVVCERGGFPEVSLFGSEAEAKERFVDIINESYEKDFQTYADAESFYDMQPDIWITFSTEEVLAA